MAKPGDGSFTSGSAIVTGSTHLAVWRIGCSGPGSLGAGNAAGSMPGGSIACALPVPVIMAAEVNVAAAVRTAIAR